jgi:8-oxo-dGTP pyrophosphatase MutT (NUDIX family)
MDFTRFSQLAPKIKNLPLPGRASHYKMAPELRIQTLEKGLEPGKNPKKAGVMALFYPDERNCTHLLFILRKTYRGVHSNQIGFPGGKQEAEDNSLLDTALRETEEEVGAERQRITVIRSMSDLYIPPSNFEVRPFIGLYRKKQPFVPQRSEVEALVEVPFSDVLDERKLTSRIMKTSYANEIIVPAFELRGYIVWGATAMMLSEIKELFKRVI